MRRITICAFKMTISKKLSMSLSEKSIVRNANAIIRKLEKLASVFV